MSSKLKGYSQPGQLTEQDIYHLTSQVLSLLEALTSNQKEIVLDYCCRVVSTNAIIDALEANGR